MLIPVNGRSSKEFLLLVFSVQGEQIQERIKEEGHKKAIYFAPANAQSYTISNLEVIHSNDRTTEYVGEFRYFTGKKEGKVKFKLPKFCVQCGRKENTSWLLNHRGICQNCEGKDND